MSEELTAAKAVVAAVGATATAVATAVAAVQVVLADSSLDMGEYGTIVTAVVTLVATVYGVWRTPNRPKLPADEPYEGWEANGM